MLRHFAAAVIAILLMVSVVQAQVDRSGLSGTVADSSGRMVPGAQVTAVRNDTGLRRVTVSSMNGSYDLPELPVGVYTVIFSHDGFQPLRFTNVVQTVGQTRTLNATLSVAGKSEVVDVFGADVNETSNSMGGRIERKQIEELPLNGRNWSTLTALVPGAIDAGGSNQRTIRFAGRGLDDNNFTADGVDATNIVNQAQQAYVRLAMPADAIQEFRIESMLFAAESGSTPGGQIAVATRSGTNQLHGKAFEFLRNSVFDARNTFDHNAEKPPFRLDQFGSSLGGPLVRNRTFLYLAYEGLRQDLGQSLIGFVPTDAFRSVVASQTPALLPILNSYPRGQQSVSAQIARFSGEGQQLDHEDSVMARLDHHFSSNTTAFARLNVDNASSSLPLSVSGQQLIDRQNLSSRPVNAVIEFLHIFSPSLVNETKFGFNRGTVVSSNAVQNGLPFSISVPGLTTENNNQTRIGVGNSFSWIDNATWVKDKHVIKSGIEVRRIQLNQGNTASGSVSFASLAAFAADHINSASFASALPINGLRKTELYAFIQDEYKWKPNFTLNLGLRYGFYNRFHEVLGRAVPFDFATCGPQGFCAPGSEFSRSNVLDIDPRIAFAWAPARLAGKTVIRSGFGIYHGDGQLDDQNLPIANEVQRFSLSQATVPGLSFPVAPFLANTAGVVSPRDMDRRRKDMVVSQWGLSIQQSLPFTMSGTLSYTGSKGTHLLTTSFINTLDPATATRQFPAFAQIEFRGNGNNSSFQALQASLQRNFRHGLLFTANYLWSHEIDDGSLGGGDADFPQNPECKRCERASGDFDARQAWNATLVYQLPFGAGQPFLSRPGILRMLLGSWQITSIVGGRTGLPVNVTVDRPASAVPDGNTTSQRPNLVPGIPLTPPSGGSAAEWINPVAFAMPAPGTFGNAPRNVARGPGIWQADAGISKRFSLGERVGLVFKAEAFNLFNRAQLGAPQSRLSAGPSFGTILSTVNTGPVGTGTPRQLQLAARVEF